MEGEGHQSKHLGRGVVWGISEQAQIALLPASTPQAEDFKINKLKLLCLLHFVSPLFDSRMVIKLV